MPKKFNEELRIRDYHTRKSYTMEQKMQILALLKEYNYNYKKTAFEVGVKIGTLKNWNYMYRDEIETSTAVQVVAQAVEVDIARYKSDYMAAHYAGMSELAGKAIDKAKELLDKDKTNLKEVTALLESLNGFIRQVADSPSSRNDTKDSANLARQQINILNMGVPQQPD